MSVTTTPILLLHFCNIATNRLVEYDFHISIQKSPLILQQTMLFEIHLLVPVLKNKYVRNSQPANLLPL